MDVFHADTIPPARENPHKIFPAVFTGFSLNDHIVQSNVFGIRTNWLISENTAFFAVCQKRTLPLVILTKKFLVSWMKRESKGRPALCGQCFWPWKRGGRCHPLRLRSFACLKPRDMETVSALASAACEADDSFIPWLSKPWYKKQVGYPKKITHLFLAFIIF